MDMVDHEDQYFTFIIETCRLKQAHPSPAYHPSKPPKHLLARTDQSFNLKDHSKRRKYRRVDEEKRVCCRCRSHRKQPYWRLRIDISSTACASP